MIPARAEAERNLRNAAGNDVNTTRRGGDKRREDGRRWLCLRENRATIVGWKLTHPKIARKFASKLAVSIKSTTFAVEISL